MRDAFVGTHGPAVARAVLLGPADDRAPLRDALAPSIQLAFYPWPITGSSARFIERSADVALCYAATRGEIAGVRELLAMPLVVLTDRDAPELRAAAIDAGADDALGAGFAPVELRARVAAAFRRAGRRPLTSIRVDDLEIDPVRRQVRRAGRQLHLTGSELTLLVALASEPGCIVRRDTLETKIWGSALPSGSGNLYTLASSLRNKLDAPPANPILRTYRGVGYALGSAGNAADALPPELLGA